MDEYRASLGYIKIYEVCAALMSIGPDRPRGIWCEMAEEYLLPSVKGGNKTLYGWKAWEIMEQW